MTQALRPFQSLASPALAAIMADTTPPAERARTMAGQLDAMILVEDFTDDQRCSLRALAFGLDFLAEAIEAQQQPQPVRARRWWRWW